MGKKVQSHGFSVVGILVIVLVVTAAGLGGWYVWHKNQKTEPAKQSSNTANNNSQKNETSQQTDPSEGGKYLVIKEWGVRFPLSEEIRGDVKYGIFTLSSGNQVAYFTSKKVVASSGTGTACDISNKKDATGEGYYGGLYAMSRSSADPNVSNGMSTHASDGYWYSWEPGGKFACYSGDTGQDSGAFRVKLEEGMAKVSPI